MSNELATRANELPDYLKGAKKEAKLGNLDRTDIIIPRVKLIQNISEEVTAYNNAKIGEFWHTIAALSMGNALLAIPIVIRKSYILWSPRNDDRGILARAMDGMHWDQPGAQFTVKPKGSTKPVTYTLGKTVQETNMDQFGSGIPEDPRSVPAASLTYNLMWMFPEYPSYSPAIIINTRSAVKKAKLLISKIELRPVDHYAQQYMISSVQETSPEGTFWNYRYESAGYASAEDYKTAKAMFEKYGGAEFLASDEREDVAERNGSNATIDDKEVPF